MSVRVHHDLKMRVGSKPKPKTAFAGPLQTLCHRVDAKLKRVGPRVGSLAISVSRSLHAHATRASDPDMVRTQDSGEQGVRLRAPRSPKVAACSFPIFFLKGSLKFSFRSGRDQPLSTDKLSRSTVQLDIRVTSYVC